MRHNKKFNHLGRTASHRAAMLSNMAASLILHKRITTTLAKAKALKMYVEPLITRSKDDSTNSRRVVFSYLQNKEAIKELFGEHAYKLNISSTKSMTGHLLGAAGAVEALACVKAVSEDIVPPTINHDEEDKDPEIDYALNYTFNQAQKRTVRAALSNTFGFGGHNACCILKKYVD